MATTRSREFSRRVLDCGATLLTMVKPGLPLFSIYAYIDAGHMVEAIGEDGLLHLAGRMLISGGAGERRGDELFELLESSGIRYATPGAGVRLEALTGKRELALDILTDAIARPRFEEDRFEIERGRLISELQAAEGNMKNVARRDWNRMVYGETHPLGRSTRGEAADVARFSRDQVVAKHERHTGPSNTIFSVAGDIDPDEIARLLDARLSGWTHAVAARPRFTEVTLAAAEEELFIERNKEKLHLFMGHIGVRRSDPDYYPLLILDNILGSGAGFTSRLAKTVRDQMGLAYTVGASITSTAGREPGVFAAYVGTFPNKLAAAREAVRAEIERLIKDGVTDQEVDNARRYLRGSFLFDTETSTQLAEMAVSIHIHDLSLDFTTRHLLELEAVTRDRVQAAARTHLHPDRMTTVAIGRRVI